jgi:hypothetical protein
LIASEIFCSPLPSKKNSYTSKQKNVFLQKLSKKQIFLQYLDTFTGGYAKYVWLKKKVNSHYYFFLINIAEKQFECANTAAIELFINKNNEFEAILLKHKAECNVLSSAFDIQIAEAHKLQKDKKELLCKSLYVLFFVFFRL